MATGIFEIATALHQAVQSVIPRSMPDVPFTGPVPGDATGSEPFAWIEEPNRALREFVISVSDLPKVSGGCHLEAGLEVRFAYTLTSADVWLIMAEDLGRLSATLRDPANWATADSVWVSDTAKTIETTSGDGRPATVVVTLPIAVYYREQL